MPAAAPPVFLSVAEVAARLKVSRQFVRNLAHGAGGRPPRLPYFRVGRLLKFDAADVAAYLADARSDAR